eukprot:COSAG05_NODE_18621_length_305_cov_1.194175_1_plen_67_part_01
MRLARRTWLLQACGAPSEHVEAGTQHASFTALRQYQGIRTAHSRQIHEAQERGTHTDRRGRKGSEGD